jgi:Aerotolerance regulator N-terminal/von Willebrand factor type A domain
MSFLTPLFLLGALAVAGPVLFHLIRRTSREEVPISSIMFLTPSPPRITKRSRLENLLLLLLRCLVIALLALGFARPFFENQATSDTGRDRRIARVFLLDTSASMRRENLWDRAQSRLLALLEKVSEEDPVAILTMDRSLKPLISFEQWSQAPASERLNLARQQLGSLKPGWAGTRLGTALVGALETFEELEARNEVTPKRRIILVTDLQEGSRLDGLQGLDWPQGVEVQVETIRAQRTTNAGLQLVSEAADLPAALPGADGPRLRVSNAADSGREQFRVGWAGPGQAAPGPGALDVCVPPGQSRIVQVSLPPDTNGTYRLLVAGDDVPFDNTAYWAPPRAELVKIAFLGNDAEENPNQMLYYLKRAFPETRRQTVQVLACRHDAAPDPAAWKDAALMVATGSLPPDRVQAIQDFLSQGKVVLMVLQTGQDGRALASVLNLGEVRVEESVAGGYAMFGSIDFQHPLFASFADPRYNDFTKIHFWKHRKLDTNGLPDVRVAAQFDRGDPALVQVPFRGGTLLVLTSGWQPSDSQLALSTKFVPILSSMLELGTGQPSRPAQYVVGEAVPLPSIHGKAPSAVQGPDGSKFHPEPGQPFRQTDLPGSYRCIYPDSSRTFAVNLAPEESRTAPLPVEQLEQLGVPMKSDLTPAAAKRAEQFQAHLKSTELENRQKLWRWLIVGAFLILILETWLAGRLTRRTPRNAS